MANRSNALQLLRRMTQADLEQLAAWRGVEVVGDRDELAKRIAKDCRRDLGQLISPASPFPRDKWNDLAQSVGAPRRRSFEDIVEGLDRHLGGRRPRSRDEPTDEDAEAQRDGAHGATIAERPSRDVVSESDDEPSAPITRALDKPRVGEVIGGRWRVLRQIGVGGMGVAYEVEGRRGMRRVAKVAHGTGGDTDALEREVTNAIELAHKNVCRYYDVDEDPRFGLFIIMQYCGESLARRYAKSPAKMGVALLLLAQAAEGLDYLHAAGWIHGDVSPANLLIDGDESTGKLRLTDFGVSSRLKTVQAASGATRVGVLHGRNAVYASAEANRGEAPRSRSDQQSLAKVFCALLFGVEEYERDPARSTFAELGRGRQDVLDLALHSDHTRRFRNCMDFVAALERGHA